jgi:hypothetical protein
LDVVLVPVPVGFVAVLDELVGLVVVVVVVVLLVGVVDDDEEEDVVLVELLVELEL